MDYRGILIEAVSKSQHPVSIPALVGALETGWLPARALARFGELAFAPVLAKARGPAERDPFAIAFAIRTLQLLYAEPLSAPARAEIRMLASGRLAGRQHFVVVGAACELAVSTQDAQLFARAFRVAHEAQVLAEMGIVNSRAVSISV